MMDKLKVRRLVSFCGSYFIWVLLISGGNPVTSQTCGGDWKTYSGSCYYFGDQRQSWKSARQTCQNLLSDLVIISDEAENGWIQDQTEGSVGSWIGLHDLTDNGNFQWINGDFLSQQDFDAWQDGEPDEAEQVGEDCVVMATSDGSWADDSCAVPYKFICERSSNDPMKCNRKEGWENANKRCYRYSGNLKALWEEAELFCQNLKGNLVSVGSIEEQSYVELQQAVHKFDLWLGLTDKYPLGKGNFSWSDGKTKFEADSFQKWAENEPNLGFYETSGDCVKIGRPYTAFRNWSTDACDSEKKFICERDEGVCPSGWYLFHGYCYQFNLNTKTYPDAKLYCEAEGASLLTILSDAENEFISMYLPIYPYRYINNLWLGLSDFANDDVLIWEHAEGDVSDGYTNWDNSQPILTQGQTDCGNIYARNNDCVWNTASCYSLHGYACKVLAGSVVSIVDDTPSDGACETGWYYFDHSCYYISQDQLGFTDSQQACESLGGNLTSINSPGEQSFVTNRMDAFRQPVWIGLNDISSEGSFKWTDQSSFDAGSSFTNWLRGEPSNATDADCVYVGGAVSELGSWISAECSTNLYYMCTKPETIPVSTIAPTTTQPPPPAEELWNCGEGWVENPDTGDCFYVYPYGDTNQETAQENCRKLGANLASIHSFEENKFIFDEFLKAQRAAGSYQNAFIGLDDKTREGGFGWTDGSPLQFLNWNSGEPNDVNGEDCAEMSDYDGTWNDIPCSQPLSYICKQSEFLSRHFNVTRGRKSKLSESAYHFNIMADECAQRCLDETSFECLAFDLSVDSNGFTFCYLLDEKVTPYDLIVQEGYDNYQRDLNVPLDQPPVPLPDNYGCEFGWMPFRNNCYRLVDTVGLFEAQRKACIEMGSQLVSILDYHENNLVNSLYIPDPEEPHYLYIGLSDSEVEGTYTWVDGSDVTYTIWETGEPNNFDGQPDCIEMDLLVGAWKDVPCNYYNKAVCKKQKTENGVVVTPPSTGCSDGYMFYDNSCFRLMDAEPMTWLDASKSCESSGGLLASSKSIFKNAFLASQLGLRAENGQFWFGLRSLYEIYQWKDSSSLTYTNWAPGQPDGNSECVSMLSGFGTAAGQWQTGSCFQKFPYICEVPAFGATFPPRTTFPPTVPSDSGCDMDWIGYGDNCFLIVTSGSKITYHQYAEEDCQALGGHLASFASREEEDYIKAKGSAGFTNPDGYWIGLVDDFQEGNWYWTDGSPVMHVNWNDGEPNNSNNNEDCVTMFFNGDGWNDAYCYKSTSYICKRPKDYETPTPPPPELQDCPSNRNWKYYKPYCYFASTSVSGGNKYWYEADAWCRSHGGYLASIHSLNEVQVVNALVDSSIASYWIGLKEEESRDLKWSDGSLYDFYRWKTGEPNSAFGEESCVQIDTSSGNRWETKNCGIPQRFVCKRAEDSIEPIVIPTASNEGGCLDDWHLYSDRCYYIGGQETADRFSYSVAKAVCDSKGGSLASIHRHDEQAFITSLLKFVRVDAWIGLSDLVTDGQFQWADEFPVTYTNWKAGKPDGQVGKDCVEMQVDDDFAGVWSNIRCDNQIGYICQMGRNASLPEKEPDFGACDFNQQYKRYGDSCFKISLIKMSYSSAQRTCQQEGTNLASLNDAYDEAFVEIQLFDELITSAWIGLHKTKDSDSDNGVQYEWEDGWPVYFTHWGENQPSEEAEEGCVIMSDQYGWHDVRCDDQHFAVCEKSLVDKPVIPTSAPVNCPEEWSAFRGSCYWFDATTRAASWHESLYTCERMGAKLASVHSKAENEFILNLAENSLVQTVWLGLLRSGGGFSWVDNTPTDYTHWDNNEPSNGVYADCVEMFIDEYGKWNDADCQMTKGFICQYTPPESEATSSTSSSTKSSQESSTSPVESSEVSSRIIPTTQSTLPPAITSAKQTGIFTTGEIFSLIAGLTGLVGFLVVLFMYIKYRMSQSGTPEVKGLGYSNAAYKSSDPSSVEFANEKDDTL